MDKYYRLGTSLQPRVNMYQSLLYQDNKVQILPAVRSASDTRKSAAKVNEGKITWSSGIKLSRKREWKQDCRQANKTEQKSSVSNTP